MSIFNYDSTVKEKKLAKLPIWIQLEKFDYWKKFGKFLFHQA